MISLGIEKYRKIIDDNHKAQMEVLAKEQERMEKQKELLRKLRNSEITVQEYKELEKAL